MHVQTVKHRWLEESAPIKLSPLREALEAGKTLLGDELPPLDLGAGRLPKLPEILPPPPKLEAEGTVPAAAAQPAHAAAPCEDTPMLEVWADQAAAQQHGQPESDQHNFQEVQHEAQPDADMTAPHGEAAPSPEPAEEPAGEATQVSHVAQRPLRGRGRGRGRGRWAARAPQQAAASFPEPALQPAEDVLEEPALAVRPAQSRPRGRGRWARGRSVGRGRGMKRKVMPLPCDCASDCLNSQGKVHHK